MAEYATSLGTSDADNIKLMALDVAGDLMGKVGFGELAFWMVAQRRPSAGEVRLFEAVLVSLADHGFTPTAIAARLTYYSAPDSIQGAVAAGLLGGGSRFLGVTENTGTYLHDVVARLGDTHDWSEREWDEAAVDSVTKAKAAGALVPGLGHPVHKHGDPRVPAMIRIATEEGVRGPHMQLFEAIGRVHEPLLGRRLPLNGAGIAGAALADLGLPISMLRGFSLLARTAGIVAQIAEEQRTPIGPDVYESVDRHAFHQAPAYPGGRPHRNG